MTNIIAACALAFSTNTVEMPSVEASAVFNSRKVERGMVENRDPVFGWEAEIEWYGLHAGFEACHDMTDINGRRGRYNELTTEAGYEHQLTRWLVVGAEYIYKEMQEEGHTQEVQFDVEMPFRLAEPFFSANIDADKYSGAFYGVVGIRRDFTTLYDCLTITPEIGIGFGNARRNEADFECGRDAARDIHLGVEAELELYDHVSLCGWFAMYDQFTQEGRAAFDNGFFVLAGCAVKLDF